MSGATESAATASYVPAPVCGTFSCLSGQPLYPLLVLVLEELARGLQGVLKSLLLCVADRMATVPPWIGYPGFLKSSQLHLAGCSSGWQLVKCGCCRQLQQHTIH